MKKTKRNSVILALAALIWGVAFVAQREGGDAIGPYAFCFLRYLIGGTVLLPVIGILDRAGLSGNRPATKAEKKTLFLGGVLSGLCLAGASFLQQVGIYRGTEAGKAGFLTACYIVLVPIIGILFKRKCGVNVWCAVGITALGLYLLCVRGTLKTETSDILVLLCSVVFSLQILIIDRFAEKNVDPVRMSCIQFFTASFLSLFPMLLSETGVTTAGIGHMLAVAFSGKALLALLYAGVMSTGVAYTLQVVGQKDVNPAVASLIMSLESVFSVLAGWAILGETMTARELLGCGFIFAAVILAQIQLPKKKKA